MNTAHVNIEETRAAAGIGVTLRKVSCGLLVFVFLALLLNGTALYRGASLMEFGARRAFCVACTRPLAAVSAALRTDRLRIWVESWPVLEER
jgi:hypothetical protein